MQTITMSNVNIGLIQGQFKNFIFLAAAAPGKVPAMPDITFRAGRPETPAVCPERTFPDETKNPIHFLLENFPGLMNSTELAYALMGKRTI